MKIENHYESFLAIINHHGSLNMNLLIVGLQHGFRMPALVLGHQLLLAMINHHEPLGAISKS